MASAVSLTNFFQSLGNPTSVGDAILSRNWAEPSVYYRALADYYELPFVDLIQDAPNRALLSALEADTYARKLTIPWKEEAGRLLIATAEPGPESLLFARKRWGNNISFVVASKFDIVWAVQTALADLLSHRAVNELAETNPELSAREVFTPGQIMTIYALATALLIGLALSPVPTLVTLNVLMSVFYFGNFVFKGILVSAGGRPFRRQGRCDRHRGARAERRRIAGLHRAGADVPGTGDAPAAGAVVARTRLSPG